MARQIWGGLVVTGSVLWSIPPEDVVEMIVSGPRRWPEPPPAHPERLVPDLPATPEEAALWRQLDFLQRLV